MAAPRVTVRASRNSDAFIVFMTMRPEEMAEVEASHGNVLQAITDSIRHSEEAWTMLFDGQIAAIYGVQRTPGLTSIADGIAWMIPTEIINKNKKAFWKECKRRVPELASRWGMLTNHIDCRHTKSIKWGERLGFKFAQPTRFGVEGRDFVMWSIGG